MLPDDLARRLADVLRAADYSYDAVAGLLGPEGHAALGRNETTPGFRATADGSALATLTRLFLLQRAVPVAEAQGALPGLVDQLCTAGLLRRSVGEVAAALDVRPYATDDADLWIVSDLTPGLDGAPSRVSADHVLGISSAATTLAQLTVRQPVARALDLGTGCGVQALHLAGHARQVVATDVNARALAMTRFNAVLNGLNTIDVRRGSYFEPVRDERFDLIATNPPFVISPGVGERLVYRDSGLPGDQVVEHIVRAAPDRLTEGGTLQVLANWMIPTGQDWRDRLADWLGGYDAWVVQREVVDLPTYVELWLKDAGLHGAPDYLSRYDTWLSWFGDCFEGRGAESVGFGWINLRRASTGRQRLEDWPYEVAMPIGDEIAAQLTRPVASDTELLAAHLRRAPDVLQETFGEPGAADPERIVLRRQTGLRRARQVDTIEAALVGAADGDLSVGQLLEAIGRLTGIPEASALPGVREMLAEGYLQW